MVTLITTAPFRLAIRSADKKFLEKIEKCVQNLMTDPSQGKRSLLGKNEQMIEINGHTLLFSYSKEEPTLFLLNLYLSNVFFEKSIKKQA